MSTISDDSVGSPRVSVRLRYWAGARAAAGVTTESVEAGTALEALALARQRRADPDFDRVIEVCSVLLDGRVVSAQDLLKPLTGPIELELLPPFAGG